MSEHMRKHHIDNAIEVIVHDKIDMKFMLPHQEAQKLLNFLRPFLVVEDNQSIPADTFFKDLHQKHGKIGSIIRGYRLRDNMTQAKLAQKIGIKQSQVSQMEHSNYDIDKKMAQRLAKVFNTNYLLFLKPVK